MKEVTKIKIEGASGYCCIEEAYNDRLTLGPTFIEYVYEPAEESEQNPLRRWSYITNSPLFEKIYREAVALLPTVFETDPENVFCTDVGGYDFTITYSDGTTWEKSFCTVGETFADLFHCISRMIPETEYSPALLLFSDSKVYISAFEERGMTRWGLFYEDNNGDKKALTEDFKPVVFDTEAEAKAKLNTIEAERSSEDAAEAFSLEEAQAFAESHKWKFATTYAKTAPHEYLVKKWLSEEDRLQFERLVQTINEHAVVGYFHGHPNNYLILGDHYYWYMDYPDNLAVDLINRTTTDYLEYRDGAYYYKEKGTDEYCRTED